MQRLSTAKGQLLYIVHVESIDPRPYSDSTGDVVRLVACMTSGKENDIVTGLTKAQSERLMAEFDLESTFPEFVCVNEHVAQLKEAGEWDDT